MFFLNVKTLRTRLDLNNKYIRFCGFKEKVIDKAQKEIKKYSDITFTYKVIKQGRTPFQIEFCVKKKLSSSQSLIKNKVSFLSPAIIEKAKFIIINSGTNWDIQEIQKQFSGYVKNKGEPKNLEAAFIGFVKKKILQPA